MDDGRLVEWETVGKGRIKTRIRYRDLSLSGKNSYVFESRNTTYLQRSVEVRNVKW
jgi:hypothetical protein